jgi:pantoate--beta-alanine ligase
VATIVLKLFQLIPAHVAYFGRKDYQQVAVIRAMVDDLNVPIRVEACETVREPDGLAMSSRNRYLSKEDRGRALGLWLALRRAQISLAAGEITGARLEEEMRMELNKAPVDAIDYAAIVHPGTMEPMDQVEESAVAIIAARLGNTRLIDNITLTVNEPGHLERTE